MSLENFKQVVDKYFEGKDLDKIIPFAIEYYFRCMSGPGYYARVDVDTLSAEEIRNYPTSEMKMLGPTPESNKYYGDCRNYVFSKFKDAFKKLVLEVLDEQKHGQY